MPTVTANVLGGFFGQYGVTMTLINGKNSQRRRAALALSRKGTYGLREIARTLDGVAAGSTATKALSRVKADVELGGKRTVESESLVNRATVAGDVTAINADVLSLSSRTYTTSPVANKDGNPLGTR